MASAAATAAPTRGPLQRHFLFVARSHTWACAQLVAAAKALPAADYCADAGLFFRSIHGTFCHMLGAERLWEARLAGGPAWAPASSLYVEDQPPLPSGRSHTAADWEALEPDASAVGEALAEQARRWEALIEDWSDAELLEAATYASTEGDECSCVRAAGLTQVFTHAAYHRGQVTAAFSKLGHAYPALDLQCRDSFWTYE